MANCGEWQVHTRHQDHGFQTGEHVSRGVGVSCGKGAVVTGIHRLQHIQRLAAANLADDDAIRTHTQCVTYKVANGDLSGSLQVSRSRFKREHMALLELNFRRILDGYDAFVIGNKGGEYVE